MGSEEFKFACEPHGGLDFAIIQISLLLLNMSPTEDTKLKVYRNAEQSPVQG